MDTNNFGYVIASKMLFEPGNTVMYFYREMPELPNDAGWRFFCGEEDQEYCDNPDNFGIYDVKSIIDLCPEITPCLSEKEAVAFERSEKTESFHIITESNRRRAEEIEKYREENHLYDLDDDQIDVLMTEEMLRDAYCLEYATAVKEAILEEIANSPYSIMDRDMSEVDEVFERLRNDYYECSKIPLDDYIAEMCMEKHQSAKHRDHQERYLD